LNQIHSGSRIERFSLIVIAQKVATPSRPWSLNYGTLRI